MNFCFLLFIFHSFSSHSGFRRFLRFKHPNYTHGFMHLILIHPHYKRHWNPGYFRTLTRNSVQHLPEHLPFEFEYQQFPGTTSLHACLGWWLDPTIAQSRELPRSASSGSQSQAEPLRGLCGGFLCSTLAVTWVLSPTCSSGRELAPAGTSLFTYWSGLRVKCSETCF